MIKSRPKFQLLKRFQYFYRLYQEKGQSCCNYLFNSLQISQQSSQPGCCCCCCCCCCWCWFLKSFVTDSQVVHLYFYPDPAFLPDDLGFLELPGGIATTCRTTELLLTNKSYLNQNIDVWHWESCFWLKNSDVKV